MAVLLDPRTGRPEQHTLLGLSGVPRVYEDNMAAGWRIGGLEDHMRDRLPGHILGLLEKSHAGAHQPGQTTVPFTVRNSMQSWEEAIYCPLSDGTQVLNSSTETIMVPDFTLPANYLYPGRAVKYTILADLSTVITTPGTIIARLRYGGVAGTLLATSGSFAPDPTAGSTTVSVMFEFFTVARASGTAASTFTMGRATWNDFDDASATTIIGNLNMMMIPVSAPAAVNVNTTTANALSPTIQFSVTTATTQFTAHIAILESVT